MFEKEAEERITEQFGTSGEYVTRQRIWQDGAEFGYKKGQSDQLVHKQYQLNQLRKANEWHYVKDGDLPEKEKYVLVYTKLENVYMARLVKDNYFINKNGGFVQTSSVIAWKEIVLPELKESE